jgi:hypothetical protein
MGDFERGRNPSTLSSPCMQQASTSRHKLRITASLLAGHGVDAAVKIQWAFPTPSSIWAFALFGRFWGTNRRNFHNAFHHRLTKPDAVTDQD